MRKVMLMVLAVLVIASLCSGIATAQSYSYSYTLSGSMDVADVQVTREKVVETTGSYWQYTYQLTNTIPNGVYVNHGLQEFSVGLTEEAAADIWGITASAEGFPTWVGTGAVVNGVDSDKVRWDFQPLYSTNSGGTPKTAKFMFKTNLEYTANTLYMTRNGSVDTGGQENGVSPSAVPEGISLTLLLTGLLPVGGLLKLRKV